MQKPIQINLLSNVNVQKVQSTLPMLFECNFISAYLIGDVCRSRFFLYIQHTVFRRTFFDKNTRIWTDCTQMDITQSEWNNCRHRSLHFSFHLNSFNAQSFDYLVANLLRSLSFCCWDRINLLVIHWKRERKKSSFRQKKLTNLIVDFQLYKNGLKQKWKNVDMIFVKIQLMREKPP